MEADSSKNFAKIILTEIFLRLPNRAQTMNELQILLNGD